MFLSNTTALVVLVALMVGSLVLVKLAQERQERNLIRLYRLAALDKRCASIINVIKNLQEVDDNPEVLRVLDQAMKSDQQRIQKLDPARGNVAQNARKGTSAGNSSAQPSSGADPKRSKVDNRTSLNSDREVIKARAYINDALALIRHLYQAQRVSGEALESTAKHLGMLSALVGVNSNIHMAEQAMSRADPKKALGHYRAAESYLMNGPLKGPEGAEKLQLILARKQQILDGEEREGAGQKYYADRVA
jgi:hypothetical protein